MIGYWTSKGRYTAYSGLTNGRYFYVSRSLVKCEPEELWTAQVYISSSIRAWGYGRTCWAALREALLNVKMFEAERKQRR